MKRSKILAVIVLAAAAAVAFAQTSSNQGSAAQPASSRVAFIYVSSGSGSTNAIYGYSAAANGKLTAIAGSPFSTGTESLYNMAINGQYLFGTDSTYIYSYSIAANGALKQTATSNPNADGNFVDGLFLDHTGTWLFDGLGNDNGYNTGAYQSNSIGAQGALTTVSTTPFNVPGNILSFIGNNLYAYTSNCYENGDTTIFGFELNQNGSLTNLNINPPVPVAKKGSYCVGEMAADPTNHLAAAMFPADDISQVGPTQLGVYTADSQGNLTTNSTAANMPATKIEVVTKIWMSPSGKLLAVAGETGLQVFHFNGASPVTPYTPLLTSDRVDQIWWDNNNHLYALSGAYATQPNLLRVFTVTPTSYIEAPGSPYALTAAGNMVVLPQK